MAFLVTNLPEPGLEGVSRDQINERGVSRQVMSNFGPRAWRMQSLGGSTRIGILGAAAKLGRAEDVLRLAVFSSEPSCGPVLCLTCTDESISCLKYRDGGTIGVRASLERPKDYEQIFIHVDQCTAAHYTEC